NREEVLRRAQRADLAEALGRLDGCEGDAELVGLAKACLSPEVAGRPGDAGEVARRVAAYQAGGQGRLRQDARRRAAAEAAAEEARATARAELARAREERKRRRLAVALAAVVVAVLGLGGGAAVWYQQDRARRQAEAGSALSEAENYLLD